MSVGKALLAPLASLRTTIWLLCLLAGLLFLNVAVPQAATVGAGEFRELVAASPWNRFVLVTLGLGRLPTSPLFLGVLGLFFLNLAVVLVGRARPAWARTRARPGAESGIQAWARMDESLAGPRPGGWDAGHTARTLRGYGYQARKIGERTIWGVKHRTAPLGFLLFHLSFFLICAGGVAIYYTRFVATAVLIEGQESKGEYARIVRRPPTGQVPRLVFSLVSVDPRFERGEPTHLGAVFRFSQAGAVVERRARVNQPAAWGPVRLLVQKAGLAPVLWFQDHDGYTLDRVASAAATRGETPTEVPLAGGKYVAVVHPRGATQGVPERADLPETPIRLSVWRRDGGAEDVLREDELLFEGELTPGRAARIGRNRLLLEEVRYWAGVLVVSERGGGLLSAGFLALIVGLVWRLVFFRREVAATWDGDHLRLVGRSEVFSLRFREELGALFSTLCGPEGRAGSRRES